MYALLLSLGEDSTTKQTNKISMLRFDPSTSWLLNYRISPNELLIDWNFKQFEYSPKKLSDFAKGHISLLSFKR